MSNLKDDSISIYEAMQNIQSGKYVMPAFQRQFVWGMEQIEKLWDSILLGYPIATFLFWHLDNNNISNDTRICNFLTEIVFNSRKQALSVNYDLSFIDLKYSDTAILDGQQRLTSLYLSLFGVAYIKPLHAKMKTGGVLTKLLIELNKHKIDVDEEEYNSKKFDIKFSDKIGKVSPTQFEIKNILDSKFKNKNTRQTAIDEVLINIPTDSKDYAKNILNTLCEKVHDEKLIRFTEIINMNQDDALEMFVRFNSGGKPLRKSDITMSILEAYWQNSKSYFGSILVGAYQNFGTDFIIRSALMLYGDVVKSNINRQIAESLKTDWEEFKNTLNKLELVLREINIDISRFASSWNVLLPIMYCIHYNANYKDNIAGIKAYLFRAIFFTYFQSGTTSKLQQMKTAMNNYEFEINLEMLEQINDLRVTEGKIEDIVNSEKGSRVAGEVLYYLSSEWYNKTYRYEQDHLHPDNRFYKAKPFTINNETWKRWLSMRNRLPNLHLLEGSLNVKKSDMSLAEYYGGMNHIQKEEFINQALIPEDCSLEFDDFEIFYEKRKALLITKIKNLLS